MDRAQVVFITTQKPAPTHEMLKMKKVYKDKSSDTTKITDCTWFKAVEVLREKKVSTPRWRRPPGGSVVVTSVVRLPGVCVPPVECTRPVVAAVAVAAATTQGRAVVS